MDDKERQAWMARVEAEVRTLPPEDAVMVRLRLFDGFTVAEIERALGIPRRQVIARIRRSLRVIREKLDSDVDVGESPGF